jgi:hypothetical protein
MRRWHDDVEVVTLGRVGVGQGRHAADVIEGFGGPRLRAGRRARRVVNRFAGYEARAKLVGVRMPTRRGFLQEIDA